MKRNKRSSCKGNMSAFNDFQKVWAARFPGCDLPQAWEEDVRANLSTHRHKVAALKEELEKEEFYVEYLERLLADVEKHKKISGKDECSRKSSIKSDDGSATDKLESGQNAGEIQDDSCEIQNGGSDKGVNGQAYKKIPELVSDDAFTQIKNDKRFCQSSEELQTGLSNVSSDTDVNKPSPPSGPNSNLIVPNHIVNSSSENAKINQYVTVIKVNGYSMQDVSAQKNSSQTRETNINDLNTKTAPKSGSSEAPVSNKSKVPPKPPPKRTKRLPSSSSLVESLNINSNSDQAASSDRENISLEKPNAQENSENTPNNPSDAKVISRTSTNTNESNGAEELSKVEGVETLDSNEIENAIDSGNVAEEIKCESPNLKTSSEVENNIIETTSKSEKETADDAALRKSETATDFISLEASNNKLEAMTEDLEGDYVTFNFDKSLEYDDLTMKSQASVLSGQSGYSSHSGHSFQSDQDGVTSSPIPPDSDSPKYSDYVNIDYFLRKKARLKYRSTSQSESMTVDSDDEDSSGGLLLSTLTSDPEEDGEKHESNSIAPSDDVFDIDSGVYSSSVESTSYIQSSTPPTGKKQVQPLSSSGSSPPLPLQSVDGQNNKIEAERIAMYKCIISSIIESEAIYLECLTVLIQYMKALRATFSTSQPVMTQDDFAVIFYKIPDLHALHDSFHDGMRSRTQNWDGKLTIGDHFKILASKLGIYASFLQNYPRAVETVRKCSNENTQFSEITKTIKLKTLKGQAMSLEDLLHKPVARVQKNALVLHDLLKYTPESHPDHKTLKTALKMTQCFLNDFNMSATENMFPVHDRAQRHLVKNSFIVELSEGHRKLRHLFLFNDVIVCAKYKASGREKFTFEVKWYIPLIEINMPQEEDIKEMREISPANILSLKTQASTVRDQVMRDEKNNASKEKQRVSGRNVDKHRKKLAELEAQLVLASPNLAFRIGQKQGKTYTFFLSSDFERMQWIEAVNNLQASAPLTNLNLTMYELQTWITTCRKYLKTNMGTFLLRSGKDDPLVGDLHIFIHSLQGLPRPADLFICLEIDSYGHFFRKAKTKIVYNTLDPVWNQDFVIELEGSQSLRILCYEQHPQQGILLRAKTTLELSRQWLPSQLQEKVVTLQEVNNLPFLLTMKLKYMPGELTLRRAPSAKPCGLFGVKINQVCKKEKRPIPFLITSCVREVERRGMSEVGIYRVSGSASDVQKLKKTFESNAYEAEQLLKEVDIHSVTGLLKLYLRELPEALFTDNLYPRFFDAFSIADNEAKKLNLLELFNALPEINQAILIFLLDHMVKINLQDGVNKMSLHNLATVFGPTLLRPGSKSDSSSPSDLLAAETIDVMAQAGILYFFLKRRAEEEPLHLE